MKRLIQLLAIVVLIGFSMQSQSQVKFGIQAGVNLNNVHQDFKNSRDEMDTKIRVGYHVGPILDITFAKFIGIQTGAFLSSKGFSLDLEKDLPVGVSSVDGYSRFSYNYIEIPLNITFNVSVLRIYAGPYVGIGVFGKFKDDYTVNYTNGTDKKFSDDMTIKPIFGEYDPADIDADQIPINLLDYGINLGAGLNFGPILLSADYSFGMGNLNAKNKNDTKYAEDHKVSNRVITIAFAILIGN